MSINLEYGVLPANSKMPFWNSAAPVGWVKELVDDNKALRIVSGTASSGGTRAFTAVFASTLPIVSSGATTLSSSQFPPHSHGIKTNTGGSTTYAAGASFDWSSSNGGNNVDTTSSGNSANSHLHSLSQSSWNAVVGLPRFDINYIDVIICIKD